MNQQIKRNLAVILSAAIVFCHAFGAAPLTEHSSFAPVTASAASNGRFSGMRNLECYYKSPDHDYTIYCTVSDSVKKTAKVIGCWTEHPNVSIRIPKTVKFFGVDYTVTEIDDWSFVLQRNIVSVFLPNTIKKIGECAFSDCDNLSNFGAEMLPNGTDYQLTEICDYAFSDCIKLESTSFLDSVTHIGEGAFQNCGSLTSIGTPNLVSLGENAFENCKSIRIIDLSQSTLTTIPSRAFSGCGANEITYLAFKLILPDSLTSIGDYAFYNLVSLKEVNLRNVETIGEYAFAECHNLKVAYTGDALYSVGERAFFDCEQMKYFVLKKHNGGIGAEGVGYTQHGKINDFTIWSSDYGGYVKKYAYYNGFNYKDIERAPVDALNKFQDYTWTFGDLYLPNSAQMLADNRGNYLYLNAHIPFVNPRHLNERFGGSCMGLASISALCYNGELSVGQFAAGYNRISDIPTNCSPFIKSFINTMWSNGAKQEKYKFQHTTTDGTFNSANDDMLKYIEYMTYEGKACVAVYGEYQNAPDVHATVCLGMEFEKNADDQSSNHQWDDMDARILLYDVNKKSFMPISCLYLNRTTGEWRKGVDRPNEYSNSDDPNFYFGLYTTADEMVGTKTASGMAYVNQLLSVPH